MFSPLFFVLMSGVQQKSSVPCPISQAKGTKLLILSSAVPPGFHPCTDAGRLSERRNGAWPFCTTAVSHRPLRSELQHRYTRKPFQPVKLLSLPDTLHVLSPSLRFCISGFHNQKSSYHISARFASAEADFVAIFRFLLVFSAGIWYAERNVLLEGGCTHMGWNGCVFFKKGNP
jgi:hypothetical protein